MAKLHVFACPSCGASLTVEGDNATTRCQFCGNTVIVPVEYRGKDETPSPSMAGMAQGQPLKELGNLVRANNKIAAIKLYRELFGSGLAEAQAAVEKLSMGQGVQVVYMGMPTTLLVDRTPPASIFGTPSVMMGGQPVQPIQPMQTVQPVIIGGNPARGLGCVMWSVFLTVGLGILITLLATGGAMLPFLGGMFGGELPDAIGDFMTGMPEIMSTVGATSTRAAPTGTPVPTPGFASAVLSFGGEGAGAGTFHDPRHIAVDGDGNIYVGEWEEHRVQVFDSEGEFVTQYSVGEADAILVSMAVDRDGALFAVAGGRLYHYDGATGELIGQIEYEDTRDFDEVVVTAEGGLVTSWSGSNVDTILRFDRNFEVDLEVPSAVTTVAEESEQDLTLAVGPDGTIYALGRYNEAIFRFSPEGVFQSRFGGAGDEPGLFVAPATLAVDHQNRVYVTDFKGIQVFDANGRYLDVFDVPDRGFIHGLTVDDDNFLYAVSNNSMVYKFALDQ